MHPVLVLAIVSLVVLWLHRRWLDRPSILLGTKMSSNKLQLLVGFGYMLSGEDSMKRIAACLQKYGKNALVYLGPFPVFLTCDPVSIKDVLCSKQCTSKPEFIYGRLSNAMGRGLITMPEPHWSIERRVYNPAFNKKNLLSYMPIFNEKTNNLLNMVDQDIENERQIEILDYFHEFTLQISTKTTTGRELSKTQYGGKEIKNMKHVMKYMSLMMCNNLYAFGIVRKLAQNTIFKKAVNLVKNHRLLIADSLREFNEKRVANASVALECMSKGVELGHVKSEHAVEGLYHILLGAFETTSTSLYFIVVMLGVHPQYQERVYEEVCNICPIGDDGDDSYEVSYDDVNQMAYLEMFINETLRFLPVVGQVSRTVANGSLALSNGYVLPEGQVVGIDIFSLHRNKEAWGPDADTFNPDHFLPSNIERTHPYAFIPFTKGVRLCLGYRYAMLSIKVAVAKLIRRYEFKAGAKLEELRIDSNVSSKMITDPKLTIERRRPKSKNV